MTKEDTLEKIIEITEKGWHCQILDDEARKQIMLLLMQFENTVTGKSHLALRNQSRYYTKQS